MILTKKNAKGHSNSKWIVKQARTNLVAAPAAPASVRKQCENATSFNGNDASGNILSICIPPRGISAVPARQRSVPSVQHFNLFDSFIFLLHTWCEIWILRSKQYSITLTDFSLSLNPNPWKSRWYCSASTQRAYVCCGICKLTLTWDSRSFCRPSGWSWLSSMTSRAYSTTLTCKDLTRHS